MERPYSSRIYLSLDFFAMGVPEILTFSAYTTELLVLFAEKIKLKPLYVNAFIINQQALSNPS